MFLLPLILTTLLAQFSSQSEPLSPYGGLEADVLLVSTLDGGLTAVRPEGPVLWSMSTGGPLLSSSISNLDFSKGAQWVKLIPSLGGGLYRFDGRQMKPLPLNAEALLRNSFKLFDSSLIISGGLATKTTGINLSSGEILYECSAEEGCNSFQQSKSEESVLVLQRRIQTVRAHEPKDGFEKWNFSVSQQQLLSLTPQGSGDPERLLSSHEDPYKLKAVISDGVLCSVDTKNEQQIRWKQKFDVPIVHVWRLRDGVLSKVDLFSDGSLPSAAKEGSPSLYVGSFENQLYIQESDSLFESVNRQTGLYFDSTKEDSLPELPWKPYLIDDKKSGAQEFPKLSKSDKSLQETTSLAVIYGDDISHSGGLYLFTSEQENETSGPGGTPPIHVVFVGISFWWKEVALISLLTVYIFNIFITRPYVNYLRDTFAQKLALRRQNLNVVVVERRVEVPVEIHVPVEVPNQSKSSQSSSSVNTEDYGCGSNDLKEEYVSRFESDYVPLESLGRGGFGIVFECKNKIDDTHYAVKRIRLPRSENSKKKVMREVKFLAKLDHKNIVRYYNTWLENPPAGWQEQRDASWEGEIEFPTQTETEDTEASGALMMTTSYRPSSTSHTFTNNNNDYDYHHNYSKSNNDSFSIRFDKSSSVSSHSEDIIFEEEEEESEEGKKSSLSSPPETLNITHNGEESNPCYSSLKGSPRSYLYIVMQLCQKESLKDWLASGGTLSLPSSSRLQEAIQIFHQICLGVEYFHKMGLIHRDLKPGNIFFSKSDGTIKIGDFGLVTHIELENSSSSESCSPSSPLGEESRDHNGQRHTDRVGTELYMSPEQLANQSYNHKVDIYSMGLILFELLVPFSTTMERISCLRGLKEDSEIPKACEGFGDLVLEMISRDPERRPEASELLSKPAFVRHAEEKAGLEHRERRRRLLTEGSSSAGEMD
eukprot:TRINITY_DN5246_c0_g1_i2.p1 TRINITY_DN5246_c0_g1~~TRINITY_DN5246_c0_g1_i2.p1  ORF type:complete len:934 (-),score=274.94 TRINITY_DN5246_c0_g1_i2:55-2856(-)